MVVRERAGKTAPRKRAAKSDDPEEVEFLPSGCTTLDKALGGGWALRRIANVVGDSSVGKTLLVMEAAANFAMKYKHGKIRYKETEAAWNPVYATALGMPMNRIDFGERIHTVEDMFDDISDACKLKVPTLEVIDSLDAISDAAELERGFADPTYGTGKARDLSKLFRMLAAEMEASNLTLMVVSQVRSRIGVSFGRKTDRAGGKALRFYCSQIVYLTHLSTLYKTVQAVRRPIALEVAAKLDKNKVGPPMREAKFKLDFGYGIDDLTSCMMWLKEVKHLADVGTNEAGYTKLVSSINRSETEAEYRERLAPIQAAVRKRWDDIETGFLPTRRKYDGC